MQEQKISVIFDETPDFEGQYVLNVLFAVVSAQGGHQIHTHLADTMFLSQCNHGTVAHAVVRVLTEYNIAFQNVISINTDHAKYMLRHTTLC